MNSAAQKIMRNTEDFLSYINHFPEFSDNNLINEKISDIEAILSDAREFELEIKKKCTEFLEQLFIQQTAEFIYDDVFFIEAWKKLSLDERKKVIHKLENAGETECAAELQKRIILFEDIPSLPDFVICKMLETIEHNVLAVSLRTHEKSADEIKTAGVLEKIRNNMKLKDGITLAEDIDFIGPCNETDVLAARKKICNVIEEILSDNEK